MLSTYFSLLKNNDQYRNLWLGTLVSYGGDWFNLIASTALINSLRTEGAGTALSYLFLARFLPLFIFSPLAGVLADRFDRRRVMILSDVLRAGTLMAFLLVREPEDLWLLYLLTVIQFTLSALFTPARTAVLANVVRRKDLVTANALDSFTWSTMLAVGALAGGIVSTLFGTSTAFVVDAFTFLLSAYFISRIVVSDELKQKKVQTGGWLSMLDGVQYLRGETVIAIICIVKGAGALVWGAYNVLEVSFAEAIFPIGEEGSIALGFILATSGIGTGFGPLVLRHYLGDSRPRLYGGITLGFALLSVGILISAVAPVFIVFIIATLIRTVGSGTVWVFSGALLQLLLPDRVRGRVFAFEFAFLTAMQSVSIFWAGYAQDSIGWSIRTVAGGMGILGIGVTLLWILFVLNRRRAWRRNQSQAPA